MELDKESLALNVSELAIEYEQLVECLNRVMFKLEEITTLVNVIQDQLGL
jgi:hypothetical protein